MKNKITLIVEKLTKILNEETPSDDWMKGRHSAFRGVKVNLEQILNEEVLAEKKVCSQCKCEDMLSSDGLCYGCDCLNNS